MKVPRFIKAWAAIIALLFIATIYAGCEERVYEHFICSGEYQGEYWPTAEWRTCKPEEVGMDSDDLYEVYNYVSRSDFVTEGVVVIRKGYIVGEEYFAGYDQSTRFSSFSVAKSFLSAVVGVAIDSGFIPSLDQLVYTYFDEWQSPETEEQKTRITLRHLLTMRSGLRFTDAQNASIVGTDIEALLASDDYVEYVLALPFIHEPGTYWNYSSGDSILLSAIVQAATGQTAYQFGMDHIFSRIGLSNITWSSDHAGHTIGGWGVGATVREFAKFGYLYLKGGAWDGEQIVSREWVQQSTRPAGADVSWYGFQWWLASYFSNYPRNGIPSDIFHAQGLYHQKIFVIPSEDLVVVRVGTDDDPNSQWNDTEFVRLILASIDRGSQLPARN
jgi:CubicO group peptidase (beta-lactamase class C family)